MQEKETGNTPFGTSNYTKEELPPIIQEYENLFQSIQAQLGQCKEEQDTLRSQLEKVIAENNFLSDHLRELSDKHSLKQNDDPSLELKTNIRGQLELAIQEKESSMELWQTALQLVTALENELKDYRDNSHLTSALEKVNEVRGEYSRAICLLEEKLSVATSRLGKEKATREFIEEQLQQVQNSYKVLNERYEKRSADVDQALAGQQAALMKLNDLEKNHIKALEEAKEATLTCSELEEALEQSVTRLEKALTEKDEAQEKVAEALQIVDAAMIERENAVSQAAQAKEETSKLQTAIAGLISEAGREVQTEAEKIKDQYNTRIQAVLVDMKRLHEENKSKNAQIHKLRADLNSMENEAQRTKRELETALCDRPSLAALDRKLEGLFRAQELAGGDAIRTELELEQLKAEIVKVNQSRELEQRQFALERHVLEEQIKALQLELEKASLTVSDVSTRADAITAALRQKDHEVNILKKALTSSIIPQYCSEKKSDSDTRSHLAEQLRILEEGSKMHHELQNQLDSQRKLTQKWKSEVNDITSRFQSRLRELRSEVYLLQKENRELRNHLKAFGHNVKNNSIDTNLDDHSSR